METGSMNADQEDEMRWNEVLKVWRAFYFQVHAGSLLGLFGGRLEMSSHEKLCGVKAAVVCKSYECDKHGLSQGGQRLVQL